MTKEILLSNIDKIHTTEMGVERIKKNLKIDIDNTICSFSSRLKVSTKRINGSRSVNTW